MSDNIRPEDGLKKVRVSCKTLRSIISEAYRRENTDPKEGYALHAGIAHWVKVPVCECHTCESLLADSRRAGRKRPPGMAMTPVINCMAAIRLKDKARAAADEGEEDRLLDLVEESLVVHQCGNVGNCRFNGLYEIDGHLQAAMNAMDTYAEFRSYAPNSAMEITTYSGSRYTLTHRDGKTWVARTPVGGDTQEEELVSFYRMGSRLIINDWFTSSVVSGRMLFAVRADREKEREQALIEEARAKDSPPWELVLDDIEESLDRIESAIEEAVA